MESTPDEPRPEAPRPPDQARARRAFLAGLGVVYAVAFLSLGSQVLGLFGAQGIAPIADMLRVAGESSSSARWELPSLFWLGASDGDLRATWVVGLLAALVATVGFAPRWSLLVAWVSYLSFVAPGYPFLSFQWDGLLLECGLLAVLYAPGGLQPFRRAQPPPPAPVRFLLTWLLFRLVFASGVVKLQSGDDAWLELTALRYHFWTQPLPHRFAHYAHQLPDVLGRIAVGAMFLVEFGAPLLCLAPARWRRTRLVGLTTIALLMLGFAATGNYGFFQLLTVVLCLALLDDRTVARLLPFVRSPVSLDRPRESRLRRTLGALLVVAVVGVTSWRAGWIELPGPLERVAVAAGRTRSFNAYGLFADMTEARPEIVIEASWDGETWRELPFRWKPGELERAPGFAHLHMPRLDWQMWFAALRGAPPRWYSSLLARVLEGSPHVLALFPADTFAEGPPVALRSTLFYYQFSSAEQRADGVWWTRERVGPYAATVVRTADGTLRSVPP